MLLSREAGVCSHLLRRYSSWDLNIELADAMVSGCAQAQLHACGLVSCGSWPSPSPAVSLSVALHGHIQASVTRPDYAGKGCCTGSSPGDSKPLGAQLLMPQQVRSDTAGKLILVCEDAADPGSAPAEAESQLKSGSPQSSPLSRVGP